MTPKQSIFDKLCSLWDGQSVSAKQFVVFYINLALGSIFFALCSLIVLKAAIFASGWHPDPEEMFGGVCFLVSIYSMVSSVAIAINRDMFR